MIYGFFHPGSGLGNQLHRYVATRVLALDRGYEFSMIGRDNFKGKPFINLEMGIQEHVSSHIESPSGKIVVDDDLIDWEEKTKYYDPEFNFIEDNTIIDGEFQDERYFGHRLKEVNEWLNVKPIYIPDDVCVIGFRGGEYSLFPDLFLTSDYWAEAMQMMWNINPEMTFEVHTDDKKLAEKYFEWPKFKVYQDISVNWRSIRCAKYSIIANSSFYILPRLLKHEDNPDAVTIAPRYWARRNTKEWSMPQNYYKSFKYI